MSMFDGVEDAKVGGNNPFITGNGHYIVRFDWAGEGKSRPPKNEKFFKVDMTVIEVLEEGSNHPRGVPVTKMWMATSEYFLSEIKGFFANITGYEPEEITSALIGSLIAENSLEGLIVEVVTYDKPKKKAPDEMFTVVDFKRRVPSGELPRLLTEKSIELYLGGQENLDAMIAAEAAA